VAVQKTFIKGSCVSACCAAVCSELQIDDEHARLGGNCFKGNHPTVMCLCDFAAQIDDNLVSSSHHCATLSKHQNGDKDIRTLLPAALLSEIDNQSMKWRGDGSKSFHPR
jgi:hypothetical protein